MMAVANIADGTMNFCWLIRFGLRLATGWMVSCRASAIRLYVCKTWKGPIDMNLAVSGVEDGCKQIDLSSKLFKDQVYYVTNTYIALLVYPGLGW